jgi:hypothetical protein
MVLGVKLNMVTRAKEAVLEELLLRVGRRWVRIQIRLNSAVCTTTRTEHLEWLSYELAPGLGCRK